MVEIDGALVDLVRRALPLGPQDQMRVRVGDAREVVTGARDAGYDLVIVDVFGGARTPAHLTSVEFMREVARVLAPDGWLIANVADGAAAQICPRPGCHDPIGVAAGLPGR